jgi:hypothetical protein
VSLKPVYDFMPAKRGSFKAKPSITQPSPLPPLQPYQSMTMIPAMGYEASTCIKTSKYPDLKRTKVKYLFYLFNFYLLILDTGMVCKGY